MEENILSEESLPELSPQIIEETEKALAIYRTSLLASTSARTTFHEKLVVVTAGSLTIVATMATSIYIKPFAEKLITHRLLELLAISSVLFFCSLIASVIHNYLETEALHLDSSAEMKNVARKLLSALVKEVLTGEKDAQAVNTVTKIIRDDVDGPFASVQATKLKKAELLRTCERGFGVAAVMFFIAGYTPLFIPQSLGRQNLRRRSTWIKRSHQANPQ
jgi:hypothetical protein